MFLKDDERGIDPLDEWPTRERWTWFLASVAFLCVIALVLR